MKKMLVGILLLAILFVGVIINSMYLENILSNIQEELKISYSLSDAEAASIIKNSFDKWRSMSKYTNTFLSYSQCEKISETYFECISKPDDLVLRDKLIYEIEMLIESENINFDSVF